jgi:2,3-bisphosphoglycerate-independent phosphoglycerate mutase
MLYIWLQIELDNFIKWSLWNDRANNLIPIVLIIRDSEGSNQHRQEDVYQAILKASMPCSNHLYRNWSHTEIQASGLAVGEPDGIMGNSDVGDRNIDAGRIIV